MKLLLEKSQRYNSHHFTYIHELRNMIYRYAKDQFMTEKFKHKFSQAKFNNNDLKRLF